MKLSDFVYLIGNPFLLSLLVQLFLMQMYI